MCGLVGVAGKSLISGEIKAFKDMLHVTSLRGPHSTGVLSVKSTGKTVLNKMIGPSNHFLDYYGDEKGYIMRDGQDMLMGHCRYATIGNINTTNAHPFDVGNLVGAHNGTLEDREFIQKDKKKTDSELMFQKMETEGVIPVLEGLDYWSDYAISLYDKSKNRLILSRNHRRPLFFAICKKANVVFWASEMRILMFGLLGNNIEVDYYTTKPRSVYIFDINTMSVFNGKKMFTEEVLPEKVKPEPKVFSSTATHGQGFQDWEWDDNVGDFRPGSVSNSTVVSKAFQKAAEKNGLPESNTTSDLGASLDDTVPF